MPNMVICPSCKLSMDHLGAPDEPVSCPRCKTTMRLQRPNGPTGAARTATGRPTWLFPAGIASAGAVPVLLLTYCLGQVGTFPSTERDRLQTAKQQLEAQLANERQQEAAAGSEATRLRLELEGRGKEIDRLKVELAELKKEKGLPWASPEAWDEQRRMLEAVTAERNQLRQSLALVRQQMNADEEHRRDEVAKKEIERKVATQQALTGAVSAEQLFADFHDNEVAADERYFQKTVKVRGRIKQVDVDREELNTPIINLVADDFIGRVECRLPYNAYGKHPDVSYLHKGHVVVIEGTCVGRHSITGNVRIRNCNVVAYDVD